MSDFMALRRAWGPGPLIAVSVGVFLQDESGRVLLQRRGDDGRWSEPGGALDPGEDFLTAARRELMEETGLTCDGLRLMPLAEGLQDGPELYHRYPHGDEVYIVGRRAEGRLPAAALDSAAPDDSGETLELRWFALDEPPPLSNNANVAGLNVLRARAGLSPLPLFPTPPPPPVGQHVMDLRRVVGQRPLFVPGASVLVTDARDRLLLLRDAGSGRWTLPGGALEPGERFLDTARRELREETGLSAEAVEPLDLFAGPQFRSTYPHGDVIDNVSLLCRAHGVSGNIQPQPDEVLDVCWFARDDLPTNLSGHLVEAQVGWWREATK